ncbi:MAG: class I SAM-dependent methyltransferase family protein [Candidatus Methanomethylicota archaeon]|uniref:Class I SAM-dependent methyltransferase family protein n=1 Tax=Thermoproteota archaeon TaxID=2056631 RepID=A0A497EZG2_9CREN|nr:MAG: class I SAM-dependent methyltransferase family protein [Candidatus Verstraetearchaeota archaeon]
MDIIGDIAVIKIPDKLLHKRFELAKALLESIPTIKVVLRKASTIKGEYRLMDLEWLAGEERFETIYREHGCTFKVDLSKVFFTPRLSGERIRIANLVREGEVIINMFAGIGTYSIIIAKHAKPREVYSIDINPDAFKLMKINIKLNKVEDKVIPILGDAREVIVEKYFNTADRVLMPLPELSLKYIPYAVKSLKNACGWIHPYEFIKVAKGENPVEKVAKIYEKELEKMDVKFSIVQGRKVGEVAPRKYRVVLDIKIEGYE